MTNNINDFNNLVDKHKSFIDNLNTDEILRKIKKKEEGSIEEVKTTFEQILKDDNIYKAFSESLNIKDIYPIQVEPIKSAVNGESFVLSWGTGVGKSLPALVSAIYWLKRDKNFGLTDITTFEQNKEYGVIYISPIRALANEKYNELRKICNNLNLDIVYSSGERNVSDRRINNSDILVTTIEKADVYLRKGIDFMYRNLCIIIDEVHSLNLPVRGGTLEGVISKIKMLKDTGVEQQLIGLSATIPNYTDIANWLHAKSYYSTWRPIKTYKGFLYSNNTIVYDPDNGKRDNIPLKNNFNEPLMNLLYTNFMFSFSTNDYTRYYPTITLNKMRNSQALVFEMRRQGVRNTAKNIKKRIGHILSKYLEWNVEEIEGRSTSLFEFSEEPDKINTYIKRYINGVIDSAYLEEKLKKEEIEELFNRILLSNDITDSLVKFQNIKNSVGLSSDEELAMELMKFGVCIHMASLSYPVRSIIEQEYIKGGIKVLVSTTTLALGINLPARLVIVNDYKRYYPVLNMKLPISSSEINQLLGRAGRPQYGIEGLALINVNTQQDMDNIEDAYINSVGDDVVSQISSKGVFTNQLLSVYDNPIIPIKSIESGINWASELFLYYTNPEYDIKNLVENSTKYLIDNNFIMERGNGIIVKPLGHITSATYLNPNTVIKFINMINHIIEHDLGINSLMLLELFVHSNEVRKLPVIGNEIDDIIEMYKEIKEFLILEYTDRNMNYIKAIIGLYHYINELPLINIEKKYGITSGDINEFSNTSEWIYSSFIALLNVINIDPDMRVLLVNKIKTIKVRILYGIKQELEELVLIHSIGRVRARELYNSDFKTIKDLAQISIPSKVSISKKEYDEDFGKLISLKGFGIKLAISIIKSAKILIK